MRALLCCALAGLALVAAAAVLGDDADWEPLQRMLEDGVAQRVFPGAAAAVFDGEHILWEGAAGNYTYGEYPPINPGVVPPVTLDVCSSHPPLLLVWSSLKAPPNRPSLTSPAQPR